jgi:hypothetical protein
MHKKSMYSWILCIPLFMSDFLSIGDSMELMVDDGAEGVMGGAAVRWVEGLFGDKAVGEEAVVLVVAGDEVIDEVDAGGCCRLG